MQVRELGYRWGSCRHKGDLYFHRRLAMLLMCFGIGWSGL
ncbi:MULTISPECIES: hypothetical protein [Cyanophyceae]